MYLFDSLHMASNALSASQLGLQIAGQNLNNADTPGYVRESLILTTGDARKTGNSINLGTGVQVSGIVQVIDQFLEERLRNATSDAVSSSAMEKYYTQLEALLRETTSNDLSTSISSFFNAIDNILNHPENETYRKMAVEEGVKLADTINRLAGKVVEMQLDVNRQINSSAEEINRLLKEIEDLNTNITLLETKQGKQAVGLRDQRLNALSELSKIINIKTTEDAKTGQVTVYCGSDILLTSGFRNEIKIGVQGSGQASAGNEVPMAQLCIGKEMSPLDVRSGSVYGLYQAHQTILGGYQSKLDTFAEELITEFNRIYTSGQGLTGYDQLTSLARTDDADVPISEALKAEGVDSLLNNGGFILQVVNTKTGVATDHYIEVRVNEPVINDPFSLKATPQTGGTTFQDLADAINKIEGMTAAVNAHGELEIKTDNGNIAFAFAQDTSGVLAALGINSFFTGTKAGSIGINPAVISDPGKFAASQGGVGADTETGVRLAALGITPNVALGGASLIGRYDGIVSETQLAAATTKAAASANVLYQESLQAQRDAISGVNIDEETVMMMTYQRMFQANSRLVTIIDQMMATLIAM
ncbi:MAG: flagellar hook-associated protein FlgK [Planctomycetaceae bacterium]|jgi:flagellar hook-associated protein 1 FlgK|nr:flagellar hook-associated protein FlgK [Planctomycetaceae bacterium]